MYIHYLVKIKRNISYFDNALLEQYLLHQAWCETWSSSSTEETNWQSWHMFKMSAFGLNTSSQVCWPLVNCTINQAAPHSCGMCVVCHFLWEDQVNQFRAPFLTVFIPLLFQVSSRKSRISYRAPWPFDFHKFQIKIVSFSVSVWNIYQLFT